MKSTIQILFAGFCWGLIGLFTRPLAAFGINPIQITSVRCIVAGITLFIYLFVKNRDELRIKITDLWMFVGTGIISIVFFNICYFTTINIATMSLAAILLYTSPYFVIVLSAILFKEKITRQKVESLIVAFIGCVLVTGFQAGGVTLKAVLTGLGSGLCYGLYSIFGNIALKKYSSMTVTFYTFVVAAAGIIPFAKLNYVAEVIREHYSVALIIVGLGLFSTMLPFLLYTLGLSKMETGKAAVLAFSEPLVATVAGIVFFNEKITMMSVVGIGLMLLALVNINGKKI